MKLVLFLNLFILFSSDHLCSDHHPPTNDHRLLSNHLHSPEAGAKVRLIRRVRGEFETDLLYKKEVQDEMDRKEREKLLNSTLQANLTDSTDRPEHSTDEELISLIKENDKSSSADQGTSNDLIEPLTTPIDDPNESSSLQPSDDTTSSLDDTNSTLDYNSTLAYNSTLDHEEAHQAGLFEIDDDQLLIDGYRTPDKEKAFLIEEFVGKLAKQQTLSAGVRLICLPDTCDQRILLVTVDRIVMKYELIKQNIFLDKAAKYFDYLNCFLIQYNPNFGLRSYLRNGFTFDFKKAFINTCFETAAANLVHGHIYLTSEFREHLKKHNLTSSVLRIKFENETYQLSLTKESRQGNYNQVINALQRIYSVYSTDADQQRLNSTCQSENEQMAVFIKVLNAGQTADRTDYLNQLNSSLFHDGLHQKLNRFRYLKAQIMFDGGLLSVSERENHKILNHLFQIIYESQNHFKQLNSYLVITRFRCKLPNDLDILSDTSIRMNVTKLYEQLRTSNQDTYYDLPAEFKLVFLSFKLNHQNSTRLLPSYSDGLVAGGPNSAIAMFDFSYLQTNHWLLSYEIAHLLGIKDDASECKCLSDRCIMRRAQDGPDALTWSDCSFRQLSANLRLHKFNFDLPTARTDFKADFFNESICGNGVLERNELCDCGRFGCFFFNLQNQSYQQNECCNSSTCSLVSPNGQCALGSCCDLSNCTFHEPTKVCRSSHDLCDIEEKCDGVTAFCPVDDHYVNGELCALNRICMNKRCQSPVNEFNCRNLLGDDAFESPICLKKNRDGSRLYNCGYSLADKRWIGCGAIEEMRCGSFQCAAARNLSSSTNTVKYLGKSFELLPTGTSVNETHECVLLVITQPDLHHEESNQTSHRPFYSPDGTTCSSRDDSLANLRFCSNGRCIANTAISDYSQCRKKANCRANQKCTAAQRCRCALESTGEFNFTSAYYCPHERSLPNYNNNGKGGGLFDRLNPYHLLIIPCLAVVLVLASFLRAYLRTGVYRLKDSSDELSVSFSGPRPTPFWSPK